MALRAYSIHIKNVKENQHSRLLKQKTQLSHKINLLDYKQGCSTWRFLLVFFFKV